MALNQQVSNRRLCTPFCPRVLRGAKQAGITQRISRRLFHLLTFASLLLGALSLLGGCSLSGPVSVAPGKTASVPLINADQRTVLWVAFNGEDPASPQSPGTPPFYPFLQRQPNCSLTRVVIDSKQAVVETDLNYQDFLHKALQVPTTADQFPNGCSDKTTGIAFQQGAIAGTFAGGNSAVAAVSPDGVIVFVVSSTGSIVSTQDYPAVPANNPNSIIYGIASADLNGDGIPDLVVAGGVFNTSASLSIFVGKGDGTFTAGQVISVPSALSASLGFTIADVNADGKLDLVAVSSAPSLSVFLGKDDGTFPVTGIAGPAGAGGSVVVSADFNGDTKQDLATNTGQILLGKGDGTFQLLTQIVGDVQFAGLAAADFNNDGKVDLAFTNPAAATIDVYSGNGAGAFTYQASYPSTFGGANIAASDLDGDGFPDLFVGTAHSGIFTADINTESMFYSTLSFGDGTFGKSRAYLPSNFTLRNFLNGTNAVFDVADFTGDSKPDVVTVDFSASGASLSVLAGNGDATFHHPGVQTSLTGISNPIAVSALAAADLNGDSKNDVVFAWTDGSGNGHISTAFGNANGTFQTQKDYAVPGSGVAVLNGALVFGNGAANGLALADVNGDHHPDIVFLAAAAAAPGATTDLFVMLNNGDGTFAPPQLIDSKPYLDYIAVADINGDGDADIAVSAGDLNHKVAATGYLYISKGDGTFQPAGTLSFGSDFPGPVAIADINGDGHLDLAFVGENNGLEGGNVQILFGDGKGNFSAGPSTPHPIFYPAGIAVADLDGDGKMDVVLGACCGFESAFIMPGNGDGTFKSAALTNLFISPNPVYLKLLDVNGDDLPELFAASSGSGVPLAIDVLATAPAPALTATSTALQASATTVNSGQSVMFTATVTPQSGTATPTGTVNFLDGATNIGSGSLNAGGVATFSTSSLSVGTHTITASYVGNSSFATSTSPSVSVTVNSAAPPDFAFTSTALNPANAAINAGQTATFTLTATPSGGFTGTVTLACSDIPPDSTCSAMPPSIDVSGPNAATSVLSVATTSRSKAAATGGSQVPIRVPRPPYLFSMLMLFFACAWFAARRQRGRLAFSLVILVFVAIAGCGSGHHTTSGTPANTYHLMVTASSGALSHTTQVTLTVN